MFHVKQRAACGETRGRARSRRRSDSDGGSCGGFDALAGSLLDRRVGGECAVRVACGVVSMRSRARYSTGGWVSVVSPGPACGRGGCVEGAITPSEAGRRDGLDTLAGSLLDRRVVGVGAAWRCARECGSALRRGADVSRETWPSSGRGRVSRRPLAAAMSVSRETVS